MKKFLLLLTILSLLLFPTLVLASEGTEEAPNQEVVVVSSEDAGIVFGVDAATVFAIFAFVALIINGILNHNAIGGYKEALARKDVRDAAERQYLQSSVSIKDAIQLFRSAVTVGAGLNIPGLDEYLEGAKDFLEDATDGEPNS